MNQPKDSTEKKPLIGISRCLLGDEVRFDGGHKRSRYIIETLGQHFDWLRVCPEVELECPCRVLPSDRYVLTMGFVC